MPLQVHGKRRAAAHDPPVKRFRVSRACDQCRTERSKCDGNQPRCAPCSENDRPCSYTSNPKKRGLPPGYIRAIELALALIFQQDTELEASLIARLGQANTVLLARDTKESNRLHKNWRRTKFCRELNKTLTGEHSVIGDDGAMSSGEDSDVAVEQESGISGVVPNVPRFALQQPQGSRVSERQPIMQQSIPLPPLTPLPPNSWQLLENYSTYTQCWFPISEKLDVMKLSYSYPGPGLVLSPDMPESGDHAEMWSIFALSSSCQDLPSSHRKHDHVELTSASSLYKIAQSLIPNELGKFHLGHVKALLNLALVNLRSSRYNPAWILVGVASRILTTLETPLRNSSSRYTHVVASCYLLDNLLALSLDRRPYLDKLDLRRAGSIEEDGLEEWQPWNGELDTPTSNQSRSPTLALSSFNRLTGLMDILVETKHTVTKDDRLRSLAEWKSTLSPKFDYIRADSTAIPITPPAILLQLAHFATLLALSPSQTWLHRALEILETCGQYLGVAKLPAVIVCLLPSIRKSSKSLPLDQATQARINKTLSDVNMNPTVEDNATLQDMPEDLNRMYTGNRFLPPGPSQVSPQSIPPQFGGPVPPRQRQTTTLLEDLLPDMNPNQQPQVPQPNHFSPINADFTSPALDAYDPSISGDLESFFDELASLHGARRLENQPQFMQNLGFAPEASMADLMATQSGQYISMDASTFGAEHEGEPLQFPLSDYYDAS